MTAHHKFSLHFSTACSLKAKSKKKNSLGIHPDLSQTIHIQVIPC